MEDGVRRTPRNDGDPPYVIGYDNSRALPTRIIDMDVHSRCVLADVFGLARPAVTTKALLPDDEEYPTIGSYLAGIMGD